MPDRITYKVFELFVRLHTGDPERYGLPKPDHRFGQAHPTVSGRILDRISHGAITPKPNIAALGPDWVRFTDGTQVHADVVVYCTGYRITFPFFDDDFIAAPDNRIDLFRRVFAPGNRSARVRRAAAAARRDHAARRGAGRAGSPTTCAAATTCRAPRACERDIRRDGERMRKRYVASKRHTIQVDFDRYLVDLARERRRGAAARRAGGHRPAGARARRGRRPSRR